jgi:hypothetical protein
MRAISPATPKGPAPGVAICRATTSGANACCERAPILCALHLPELVSGAKCVARRTRAGRLRSQYWRSSRRGPGRAGLWRVPPGRGVVSSPRSLLARGFSAALSSLQACVRQDAQGCHVHRGLRRLEHCRGAKAQGCGAGCVVGCAAAKVPFCAIQSFVVLLRLTPTQHAVARSFNASPQRALEPSARAKQATGTVRFAPCDPAPLVVLISGAGSHRCSFVCIVSHNRVPQDNPPRQGA